MEKVLISGGAGFIGSHIVDILIKSGYEAIVIDNLGSGRLDYLNKKAVFYFCDITNMRDLLNVFEKEKPEIVIHAAAQTMLRKSFEDAVDDSMKNIVGTINILECCRRFNVKKIIYTSTGGARVGEPEYLPVDEKHPVNPCSPYGISKHSAEHYIKAYSGLYGFDYLIFCFGNVYWPRDNLAAGRVVSVFINSILRGETLLYFEMEIKQGILFM